MPTDDPPTLILLHAFPLDLDMCRQQVAALGGKQRVLALDLPGFGQSPQRSGFTVDSAADLEAQTAPDRVVVCGLSMGGYVALAFARRYPERLAGLILADTRSEPDDPTGKQNRDRMIGLTREFGPSAVYDAMLPKILSEGTRTQRIEVVEEVRRIAARQSAEGVIGGLIALRDRPDATPVLADIAVPTLILVGEHDAITPPVVASAMAARIRGSKLITIPGAGHLSNLENPAAFNAAVAEFLDTHLCR